MAWLCLLIASGCVQAPEPALPTELGSVEHEGVPVENAGFEQWIPARPAGWGIHNPFEGCVSREPGSSDDEITLVSSPAAFYNSFTQVLAIPEAASGKVLVLYVDALAAERESVSCSMRIEGTGFFHSDFHPGDGAWHTLRVSCRVPPYAVGEGLTVILGHADQPQHQAKFRRVRLLIEHPRAKDG
jgi:hypothetical protein